MYVFAKWTVYLEQNISRGFLHRRSTHRWISNRPIFLIIHNFFRIKFLIMPEPRRTFDSIVILEPFKVKPTLTSTKLFLHWVQGWTIRQWGSKISKDRIQKWKKHFSHKVSKKNQFEKSPKKLLWLSWKLKCLTLHWWEVIVEKNISNF